MDDMDKKSSDQLDDMEMIVWRNKQKHKVYLEFCKSNLMKFLLKVLECLPSSLNCAGKPKKLDKQK